MKRKSIFKAVVAIIVALVFVMPVSVAFANIELTLQIQPKMSILPATQTVHKDDSFTVDVYIDPKDYQIVGANVDMLSFDSTVIQATEPMAVTFQDFFGSAVVYRLPGTIDNVAGTITGIGEVTTPFAPTNTANVWVTIGFTAIDFGTSLITMDIVGLPDENGDKIDPITVINGEVIVEGFPVKWDITLNFIEDGGKNDYVVFGEASDANDVPPYDSYDVMKPPAPMQPYLRAWFDDSLLYPYDLLWGDYRRYPDTDKTWDLYVRWVNSGYTPTNVTISWDNSKFDDSEYNYVGLYNNSGGFLTDMRAADQYAFPVEREIYSFQIIASGGAENNPPNIPSNPNPNNGRTGVDTNADLSWTGGDPDNDMVLYDVYFGKSSIPLKVVGNQSDTTYDPGTLDYETTYYWNIVAWDDQSASTYGPIWSFTTKSSDSGGPNGQPPTPPPENEPPTSDANGPYIGVIGIPVVFDGSGSNDPDGTITNYTWYFGDGMEGYGEITNHTYTKIGRYAVTLSVTDDGGIKRSDLTYAIITSMANNPPSIPVVTGPTVGKKNIICNYTVMSTDPDNDTVRYFFDWDEDNTTSDYSASGMFYNTSHTWTTGGVYTVMVYAEDENYGVSDMAEMTIFIDVQFIDDVIQGYLLDSDNDGVYDVFHNNVTGNKINVELQDNGNYLIDIDGDGSWNYEYNSEANILAPYHSEEKSTEEPGYLFLVWIMIAAIAIVVFVSGVKKLKLKKEVRREMKKKAEGGDKL